ncbi:hypothetical protein ATK36_0475 [Amycolatopsis sulphurea]|uniref:Uncharacterized protein n=1 Tax=Amycolatopsis sulphurea TaxID=76022 RepID=A0A2A9G2R0_9PSEU|nr:hypothetical protein ATK36_0475 [Amycolatopsis sulphurea]
MDTTGDHPAGSRGTGAEVVLCIDADCPGCGWPERTLTLPRGVFGCPKCTHTSTDRGV